MVIYNFKQEKKIILMKESKLKISNRPMYLNLQFIE